MQSASNILVLQHLNIQHVLVIHQKKKLTDLLNESRKSAKTIGLVPTMGTLHQGHFSLIEKAQAESDLVVVSIFVNPTQFDKKSDLENYPQNLDEDVQKIDRNFENIIIFAPNVNEVYGSDLTSEQFDFGPLATKMEGRFRSGHFDGVGTVLKKLFGIIEPDKAFFGEKDYQQFLIVKKLVDLIDQPIEIVGCPINRQENGLARSSRNKRLSKTEQDEATLLYKSLKKAEENFGTKDANIIIDQVQQDFKAHNGLKLDYFEIADAETLESARTIENNRNYRAFIAAHLNGVRLIDNMALN